jgi:hypothetical protein
MSCLRSIVYVSTACNALAVVELESLLRSARDANLENSITGILLFDDGNFMQCFEGPTDAVYSTYDRIKASRQHKDIIELMDDRVAGRSFKSWEMGIARPTPSEILRLSTATWMSEGGEPTEFGRPAAGLGLLWEFWQNGLRGL